MKGLRCYCCGKPIADKVVLVSMTPTGIDRVFLVHPDACFLLVKDDAAIAWHVRRDSK